VSASIRRAPRRAVPDRPATGRSKGRRRAEALRVPAITAWFWIAKALSTAFGESASDSLVRILGPVPAVLLGAATFVGALAVQLRVRRYQAVPYWLAVVMVGVFGTMAADVVHVGIGVPYAASASLAAVALAVVFAVWWRFEGTLSVHTIDSDRRERFYWSAVAVTFALGTAVGDLTAVTLRLGYAWSIVLFAALIAVPIVGFVRLRWNPIASFWAAYVLTRPLGASVADYLGKPTADGGAGWGSVQVSLGLAACIVGCVAYLATTRRDVQPDAAHPVPSPA
jgi:uncharacterized membrane-anchored protein